MNVAEIVERKRQEINQVSREILALLADKMQSDSYSQMDYRIHLLDEQRRNLESTVFSLTFMGPVATPEMQAEHRAQQWYKREHERAMKRKALVDKVLGEQQ